MTDFFTVRAFNACQQLQQRDAALALLKEKGLTIRRPERLTGINRGVIRRAKCVKENRPR